jgi:hypothetical protein
MNSQHRVLRIAALAIYFTGLILAAAFAAGAAWADFEASLFDVNSMSLAQQNIGSFSCPVAITRNEIGKVRASVSNPTDSARNFTVRAHVSEGFVLWMAEDEQVVPLEPGHTKTLEWSVSPEQAAWERLILVRVYVPRNRQIPPQTASCGILLLDTVALSGSTIVGGMLGASLLGIVGGIGLWAAASRPLTEQRRQRLYGLLAVGGMILAAVIGGLLGVYVLVGAALGLTVLVGISVMSWASAS